MEKTHIDIDTEILWTACRSYVGSIWLLEVVALKEGVSLRDWGFDSKNFYLETGASIQRTSFQSLNL